MYVAQYTGQHQQADLYHADHRSTKLACMNLADRGQFEFQGKDAKESVPESCLRDQFEQDTGLLFLL